MNLPRGLLLAASLCATAAIARGADVGKGIVRSFLATGKATTIVSFDGPDSPGHVVWRYPAITREGWVLPSGNIVLALGHSDAYPGGAAVEVTRDNKIVWEYRGTQQELNSVQKTDDGTYVVTEAGKNPRLLEIDAAGRVLVDFPLACQTANTHLETRMARKLADGTYLVPHLLDFAVKQYDRTGKVLQVIDTAQPHDPDRKIRSWPFTAIRLPNGHTLVGLTLADRVAEYDAAGKPVWEVTNDDVGGIIRNACGVQRLPNGNTVINNFGAGKNQIKLFEVTPDKKVVWTYRSSDPEHIHSFQVLDTNGVPLEGPALK